VEPGVLIKMGSSGYSLNREHPTDAAEEVLASRVLRKPRGFTTSI
jgi:hypothetical protein